jgi:hypothetical protein
MNLSFVTTTLRGRSIALVALALSATVASTANAQITAPVGTGEIGYNIYNPGGPTQTYFDIGTGGVSASQGYNFVYANGVTTANGSEGNVTMQGLPSGEGTGAYLALDGDYNTLNSGPLANQPIAVGTELTGLTVGNSYTLTYYAADDQQTGYSGDTKDDVTACVGAVATLEANPEAGTCASTGVVDDSNKNPSPNTTPFLAYSNLTFTAASSTELLTLLDVGQPAGNAPAFALIDGLSLANNGPLPPTPEPSSLLLLSTGLIGVGGLLRSRFKKSEKAV